jgi:hypothetical protein
LGRACTPACVPGGDKPGDEAVWRDESVLTPSLAYLDSARCAVWLVRWGARGCDITVKSKLFTAAVAVVLATLVTCCMPFAAAPSRFTRASAPCPRLDSRLATLSRSIDPKQFAAEARLELDPSGVRVFVEMDRGMTLALHSGVYLESVYGDTIQARVALSELCAVARLPGVVSVTPPTHGVPDSGRP